MASLSDITGLCRRASSRRHSELYLQLILYINMSVCLCVHVCVCVRVLTDTPLHSIYDSYKTSSSPSGHRTNTSTAQHATVDDLIPYRVRRHSATTGTIYHTQVHAACAAATINENPEKKSPQLDTSNPVSLVAIILCMRLKRCAYTCRCRRGVKGAQAPLGPRKILKFEVFHLGSGGGGGGGPHKMPKFEMSTPF